MTTGAQIPLFRDVDFKVGRHRKGDWPTSIQGAKDVSYRSGTQKYRLLEVYQSAYPEPLTDEEAALKAGLSMVSCYWKRCGELRQDGLIEVVTDAEGHPVTREGTAGVKRIVSVFRKGG